MRYIEISCIGVLDCGRRAEMIIGVRVVMGDGFGVGLKMENGWSKLNVLNANLKVNG